MSSALPTDTFKLGFIYGNIPSYIRDVNIDVYDASNLKILTFIVVTPGQHEFMLPANARSITVINKSTELVTFNCMPSYKMENYWSVS